MINKILLSYDNNRNDEENILLINAWNEWGEKMTLEPSEMYNNKHLDMIKNNITERIY